MKLLGVVTLLASLQSAVAVGTGPGTHTIKLDARDGAATVEAGGVAVHVVKATGRYSVQVDGQDWLAGAPPRYLPGHSLIMTNPARTGSGQDALGTYSAVTLSWAASGMGDGVVLETRFAAYAARQLLTFRQTYVAGIANTSHYFNTSTPAFTGTCIPTSDRVPPLDLASARLHGHQDEQGNTAGHSKVLPATTAKALGAFPAFSLRTPAATLNWFTPQGNQLASTNFGRFAPLRFNALNGQGSMPLLLYNASLRTIALTPLDNFFVAVHETTTAPHDVLAAGPAASVETIPPGFEYTTALTSGHGLNATMFEVGKMLLGFGNKTRADPYTSRTSFMLTHLGFWVDNGSPYYHSNVSYAASKGLSECNEALNCTLQDALVAVRNDAAERGIPLRYFQFDDHESLDAYHWPDTMAAPYLNEESAAQANAGDVVFQDGVLFLGNDPYNTSRPFPLSLYIGHGDTRPCLYDSGRPFPGDHDGPRCSDIQNTSAYGFEWHDGVCVSKDFFKGLMINGSRAGMLMFEQDYLCATQLASTKDLTTGARWFKALDDAVAETGMDLQLCMMNPAHALASTTMHTVSNGRGTQDHADRSATNGLPLGWSSLVLISLGMWPSRDNVWTNSSVKLGYNPKWQMQEAMPDLQTAMAVLSGGPYGPADIAGAMNRSLVMRSCRSDGVLLRPSWPATAIDASFRLSFDTLRPTYLWAARSSIGPLTYVYLLSINLDAPLRVRMADIYPLSELPPAREFAVVEGWHGVARGAVTVVRGDGAIPVPATPQQTMYIAGHSLWFVAPMQKGWAYLGEGDKIVKASHRRVQAITVAKDGLSIRVQLILAEGEVVYPSILTGKTKVLTASCNANDASRMDTSLPERMPLSVFGDVDVTLTLTCTLTSCSCVH